MDTLRHELDRRTGRRWIVWRLHFEGEDLVMVSPLVNRNRDRHRQRDDNTPVDHVQWAYSVFGPFQRCAKFPYADIGLYIERLKGL